MWGLCTKPAVDQLLDHRAGVEAEACLRVVVKCGSGVAQCFSWGATQSFVLDLEDCAEPHNHLTSHRLTPRLDDFMDSW
jgi:hypothetical protein